MVVHCNKCHIYRPNDTVKEPYLSNRAVGVTNYFCTLSLKTKLFQKQKSFLAMW